MFHQIFGNGYIKVKLKSQEDAIHPRNLVKVICIFVPVEENFITLEPQ